MRNYTIYLDKPAEEWEMASPVGNGRMGAMVYGIPECERIQLNEEFIWAGEKINTDYPAFRDKIEHIRQLLLAGKAAEADEWASTNLNDAFSRVKSYETAGDLYIDYGFTDPTENNSNYRRYLNLINGISQVTFRRGGIGYSREVFASYPDDVICIKLLGKLNLTFRYERENIKSIDCSGDTMTVRAATTDDLHPFTVKLKIATDGKLGCGDRFMTVADATECMVYITAATEREPEFPESLSYGKLRERHITDFSTLMKRSEILLEENENQELESLPVSRRLERVKNGKCDPGLVELYFQFGKYLLVGSSRTGTLPANLQGVWNGYIDAPWNSDYHTNINLQMNYWHAESANLSECTEPLFRYMNDYLLQSGKNTAKVNYKCRGTVLHHLSDVYGFTAPADGLWGLWPMGGAWLCYHMWEHYLYTGDLDYLRDTAYEYISQSARFFLDYMFETEDGLLLSGPSTSPENRYLQNGTAAYLCMSPTMDIEIIGGLLKFYIETEKLLHINPEWASEAEKALKKLPPLQIGKHGQLMEWLEDYDEPEPGHRHISHMFALYPDAAINPDTPELFEGARQTIKRRLANGGGHTGWSCAWLIALHARLFDSEGVYKNLQKLLSKSTKDNLFDTHPPFQIDGNFGASAALIEMVMQSQNGTIRLLPATPEEFASGSFKGLKARGNVTVSAEWKNLTVVKAELYAADDVSFKLIVNGEEKQISLKAGEIYKYAK